MNIQGRRCICLTVFFLIGLNAGFAQGTKVTTTLSLTLTNPITPSLRTYMFGSAMAVVDGERVIIGAPYPFEQSRGAAYLFNTNGNLLRSFTRPAADPGEHNFGATLAVLGSDRVIIGASEYGDSDSCRAYVFSLDGTLLETIRNPSTKVFGYPVAALGSDRIMVGAGPAGVDDVGAAYLFTTNGTLITTFTNPAPERGDFFGMLIAPIGVDRMVIGAPNYLSNNAAVYLFNTNGTLLKAFTNFFTFLRPNPAMLTLGDLTTIGDDLILIGAVGANAQGQDASTVYLIDTNGTVVTTFTNPAINMPNFGMRLAPVGADKLLIGAQDFPVRAEPFGGFYEPTNGAVYLFSTNGTLLTTLTNRAPADQFGSSLGAVGNLLIIGAWRASNAPEEVPGNVYLYHWSVAAPRVDIQRLPGGIMRFSWPAAAADYVLEQSPEISPNSVGSAWTPVALPYQTNATHISTTLSSSGNRFFRLRGR
jgi:hypothetical protein